ncbi:hypothetical protein PybrP1_009940 [[Pythium] brassicae (nom. inval.)]|nr:hypothetical protein PybrP1_009940 [[Pythium] brassicae (nom. inval.)]
MKDRALLASQWSLAGRSSDVGDIQFSQLQWNDSFLIVRLMRKKTRQYHSTAMFPVVLQWEHDQLHGLAALLVVDRFNLSECVFSQINFEPSQDNVAAYISRLIDSLSAIGNSAFPTRNLKSHSSPAAAAVAASNSEINFSDLAHRGR